MPPTLRKLVRCLLFTIATVWLAEGAAAENWPAFQNGGNTSIDAGNLPIEWTPHEGLGRRTAGLRPVGTGGVGESGLPHGGGRGPAADPDRRRLGRHFGQAALEADISRHGATEDQLHGQPRRSHATGRRSASICAVHRAYAYYVNRVGVLYCLNAATGEQCYARRIAGPCWAQPIACGEHLYFFAKNGVTTVARAGPSFEQVARNRLWTEDAPPTPTRSYEYEPEGNTDLRPRHPNREYLDPIVYGVAAVDGAFFVRLGTHLYRVGGSR